MATTQIDQEIVEYAIPLYIRVDVHQVVVEYVQQTLTTFQLDQFVIEYIRGTPPGAPGCPVDDDFTSLVGAPANGCAVSDSFGT